MNQKPMLERFLGQKQLSRGILRKTCSENMQQIYWTPMPKCDFNNVTEELHWHHIRHGCPPVLLHIFRKPFLKNTSGGLLLSKPPPPEFQNTNFFLKLGPWRLKIPAVLKYNCKQIWKIVRKCQQFNFSI